MIPHARLTTRLAIAAVAALLAVGLLPGSGPAPLEANPIEPYYWGVDAVSWGEGPIDVFGVGSGDALWHKYYAQGQGWSGWENFGGVSYDRPAVSSWAEGRLDVFNFDEYSGNLWHMWFDWDQSEFFSDWENLGAP